MTGAIAAAWAHQGGARGALGSPVAASVRAANGLTAQQFQHGRIVWSPKTGAHVELAAKR